MRATARRLDCVFGLRHFFHQSLGLNILTDIHLSEGNRLAARAAFDQLRIVMDQPDTVGNAYIWPDTEVRLELSEQGWRTAEPVAVDAVASTEGQPLYHGRALLALAQVWIAKRTGVEQVIDTLAKARASFEACDARPELAAAFEVEASLWETEGQQQRVAHALAEAHARYAAMGAVGHAERLAG